MKKIVCIILAALTLFALIGCGETANDPAATTAGKADPSGDNSQEPVVTTSKYPDNLPEKMDFGGETISIVSMDKDWWIDEVTPNGDDGTVINNSVAQRNSIVEERLNVKIENTKLQTTSYGVLVDEVERDYRDGAGTYDISFCNGYVACMAIPKGYFFDLNKVENIDLSKDYWMQGFNEQLSFHGKQYVATGDISISTVRMAFATIFNKKMFETNHVPSLYETVKNKEWTLEYQLKLLDTLYKPVSAEGPSDEDTFAYASGNYVACDGYWEACDVSILRKDANGDYYHSTDTERYSDMVDQLLLFFRQPGTRNFPHKSGDGEFADISKFFADGRAAMANILLVECEREWTRNMSDPYGIVPLAKLNKDQEAHHTHLFDQYTVVSVLKGSKKDNNAMLGAFLEAMASESSVVTMPAYYELTLKQKYQSDPTSWEMLDLIMDGVICDAGNLYYSLVGEAHMDLARMIQEGSNQVASKMAAYKRAMPAYLKGLNKSLASVE